MIFSLKVRTMSLSTATPVELSAGELLTREGAVPSITIALEFASEPAAPGAGSVRSAEVLSADYLIIPPLSDRAVVPV